MLSYGWLNAATWWFLLIDGHCCFAWWNYWSNISELAKSRFQTSWWAITHLSSIWPEHAFFDTTVSYFFIVITFIKVSDMVLMLAVNFLFWTSCPKAVIKIVCFLSSWRSDSRIWRIIIGYRITTLILQYTFIKVLYLAISWFSIGFIRFTSGF